MSRCNGLVGLLLGHKYAPRYSYGAPTLENLSCERASTNKVTKIMDASKPATYAGDVCERCGDTIVLSGGEL